VNRQVLVVLIALLLRFIYLFTFAKTLFFNTFSDGLYYHKWALDIIAGHAPSPPFFMSPLYPYFIAFFYKLFGADQTLILFIQTLLDTGTTYLIYRIGSSLWGERAGLIGSIIYAIGPIPIFYSGLFLMPTLLTFILTLGLWVIATRRDPFWAGLIFGIGVIGRGTILIPALVPLFYLRKLRYLIGLALPILLLFVINLGIGGTPVPTTYNFGINLYIGNNPRADGTYRRPPGLDLIHDPDGRKVIGQKLGKAVTPLESSRYWSGLAFDYIQRNPIQALFLLMRKFYLFWGPLEVLQLENIYYVLDRSFLKFLPMRIWLIIPLFLTSLLALSRRTRWLSLIALFYSLSLLPFFIIGRFRAAINPIIVLTGGALIDRLIAKRGRIGVFNLILLLSLLICYIFLRIYGNDTIKEWIIETRCDRAYWTYLNDHPWAFQDSTRAILRENPDCIIALDNLGGYYFCIGEFELAREYLHRALALNPQDGVAIYNLALLYLRLNKPDSALYYLKKARRLMPFNYRIEPMMRSAQRLLTP